MDYSLASSEIEQIAVTHVTKANDPKAKVSEISQNMQNTISAVAILRGRLNHLIKMVEQSSEVRANHEFIRRLN